MSSKLLTQSIKISIIQLETTHQNIANLISNILFGNNLNDSRSATSNKSIERRPIF